MRALEEPLSFPQIDSPVLVVVSVSTWAAGRLQPTSYHVARRGRVTSICDDRNDFQPAFWCHLEGHDRDDTYVQLKGEGIEWARGHDEETEGALLAAHALGSP